MESKIKYKPNPEYRLMDQVRECLRYYQELIELKYYFQAGTWYEYGTIVKTFKNISAYSKLVRNLR